uniref:Uncharacterized protein n=1 Tax=Caenorhabditis japonica TaxID=281687 RepID=A0A8R1EE78_CAEJA
MANITTNPAYKYSIVNGLEKSRNERTMVSALRSVVTVTATRAPKTLMCAFSRKNGTALKISPERTTYVKMKVEPIPYE